MKRVLKILCLSIFLAPILSDANVGLVILAGGKDRVTAEQWLQKFKTDSNLEVSYFPGYPMILESKSIAGLNPGLWIVVAGRCLLGDAVSYSDTFKPVEQFFAKNVKGSYIRKVKINGVNPWECPLLEKRIDLESKNAVQQILDLGQKYFSEADFGKSDYLAKYVLIRDPKNSEAKGLLEKIMVLSTD